MQLDGDDSPTVKDMRRSAWSPDPHKAKNALRFSRRAFRLDSLSTCGCAGAIWSAYYGPSMELEVRVA